MLLRECKSQCTDLHLLAMRSHVDGALRALTKPMQLCCTNVKLRASVHVDGKLVSEIGQGMCVLVGICRTDTAADMDYVGTCTSPANTQ